MNKTCCTPHLILMSGRNEVNNYDNDHDHNNDVQFDQAILFSKTRFISAKFTDSKFNSLNL